MTSDPCRSPLPSPTRAAGLARLRDFVGDAGRAYASLRNHDLPGHPHVSRLSAHVRHRLVTEEEVLATVLGRHSRAAAEKFVQEVYWRTYWKGWLERRPSVWTGYRAGVLRGLDRVAAETGLRDRWQAACTGETGIDAFDHWARELVQTGYLHNHARMWFASIWNFTLRLPWELGADLFLRHLADGDPASNTLGWRWVAGLQTPGTTYLARADNIARYTEGRFSPRGLATEALPVEGPPNPPAGPMPCGGAWDPDLRTGLLLTEDDLSPGFLTARGLLPSGIGLLACDDARSPLDTAAPVRAFTSAAIADMAARQAGGPDALAGPWRGDDAVDAAFDWASGFRQIVMPWAPTGPARDRVDALARRLDAAGIPLVRVLRDHDAAAWPHATHGFFRFREKIPTLLSRHSA